MTYARLFLRGVLIVALTAWNVRHIAVLDYRMGAVGGFWISFVWWGNSRGAAHNELRYAREVYAAGAAVGTVIGMYLGK